MTGVVAVLEQLPPLVVLAMAVLLVMGETGVIVGLSFPVEITLLFVGFLAYLGEVPLVPAFLLMIAAAMTGDALALRSGRKYGPRVRASRFGARIGERRWAKADRILHRFGGRSAFVARWVPFVRTLLPRLAGSAGMRYRQFAPWNAAGVVTAVGGSVVLGYLAGASYQQVADRLAVPAALAVPVRATPAPLDLGYLRYPDDQTAPVSAEVTYTNRGDQAVTLELSVAVARRERGGGPGDPPPPPPPAGTRSTGPVTVDPASVTVPPGGSATATVTVDPTVAEPGTYGGLLVASQDGAPVTRTPVGFHQEPESYQLNLTGIARDGRPAAGLSNLVQVLNVDDPRAFLETVFLFEGAGTATLRVPAGTYSVLGLISSYDEDHRWEQDHTFVGDPELAVTGDTTLVLDAREASPVVVETPAHEAAAPIQFAQVVHWRATGEDAFPVSYLVRPLPMYAQATDPVTVGDFELFSRWRIGEPVAALRVAAPAGGQLHPWPMTGSPAVTGDASLHLVDAGLGAPEDYQGVDATGAIVLTGRGGPDEAAKEAAARAAGAAALVVSNDRAGNYRAAAGDAAGIPSLTLSRTEGDLLRGLLAAGPVTLRLSGTPTTRYLYDLVLPEPGHVPADLRYRLSTADLATVEQAYHSDRADQRLSDTRFTYRPWADWSHTLSTTLAAPLARTDYLVPGDISYQHLVGHRATSGAALYEPTAQYQAGERRVQSWFAPVRRPGLRADSPLLPAQPAVRDGDLLTLPVTEWVDGYGNFGDGAADRIDTSTARLFADGELVAEQTGAAGSFRVAAAPAEYRYEVEVAREADWWATSTNTRTAWTFRSGQTSDVELVPLLLVDYQVLADLHNTAAAGGTVGLRVHHQPGMVAPTIDTAALWVLYDDGGSWREAAVRATDDGELEAALPAPADEEGFVSLRFEATDTEGNRVEQEILRAWRYQGPACDRVVAGRHRGPLLVSSGLTCLAEGAVVTGPVHVRPGAGLLATGASVRGSVTAAGAVRVELRGSRLVGPVSVVGSTGELVLAGNRVTGPVMLVGNATGETPIVVSGNRVTGPLICLANHPAPVDHGVPNVVTGPVVGQCTGV